MTTFRVTVYGGVGAVSKTKLVQVVAADPGTAVNFAIAEFVCEAGPSSKVDSVELDVVR